MLVNKEGIKAGINAFMLLYGPNFIINRFFFGLTMLVKAHSLVGTIGLHGEKP